MTAFGSQCITCDSYTCLNCQLGYGISASGACGFCPAMISNCLDCSNYSACLGCNVGYTVSGSGPGSCVTCSSLIPQCTFCNNGPICTSCNPGFVLDYSTPNRNCVPCSVITNCLSCQNGPECLQCSTNFIPNIAAPSNQCIPCPSGQYSSSNTLCSPCPIQCTACYKSGTNVLCTACSTGYAIDSATQNCLSCSTFMNKCALCLDQTVCTSCQSPYMLGDTQLCDKCQAGIEYINGICTRLIGCSNFLPDYSQCIACRIQHNFVTDPVTKQCKCIAGFYSQFINGVAQCLNKCGDGILAFGYETCDDGNLRNDDGCSDLCKQEDGFSCAPGSPSQCALQYTPTRLDYNYARHYEGENKCRFSVSLHPSHPGLQYVDWSRYLTFNISEDFIIKTSKVFTYFLQTSELTIDFEFVKTIEDIKVKFELSADEAIVSMTRQTDSTEGNYNNSEITENSFVSFQVGQTSISSPTLSILKKLTLIVDIKGINSKLIYESNGIMSAYESANIVCLIITILTLLQFVVASYFHKMIGLETIQILQFFFFIRIIIEKNYSTFLNSMNVLRYVAYGGYTNYEIFYGKQSQIAESLTLMTIDEKFVTVGLMKYFTLNVNISLVVPLLILLGFLFTLIRKYLKRSAYMKTRDQTIKDQYTTLRRSFQWVYDHFVFPYLNMFSMIVIFSTILYLQSQSTDASTEIENSLIIQSIESTSFIPHLSILFLTFLIFCSQVFQSHEDYNHSKLTQQEKARITQSIEQKLEHDENNPDKPNYKPGYIFFYLVFYFLVEFLMMLDVLLVPLKDFGVQIMVVLSLLYFVFVWRWKPYNSAVEFHNKTLIFNHFTVFLFMLITSVSKRIEISTIFYVVFVYIILVMLGIVVAGGFFRILIEHRFRKKLLDDPTLMAGHETHNKKEKIKGEKGKISSNRKENLLLNNPFVFENQIKHLLMTRDYSINQRLTDEEINEAKFKLRKQIFGKRERNNLIEITRRFQRQESFVYGDLISSSLKPQQMSFQEIKSSLMMEKINSNSDPQTAQKKIDRYQTNQTNAN